jgi:hypothetical protein
MKKYILIYKSNNRNLKIEFVNDTLLDFVNDLERFKSKNMIYERSNIRIKRGGINDYDNTRYNR